MGKNKLGDLVNELIELRMDQVGRMLAREIFDKSITEEKRVILDTKMKDSRTRVKEIIQELNVLE